MNETWIDKDEKTIRDDIVAIAKQETGLTNFKNVGVLRGLIEVISRAVFFIYRTAINPSYANATLDQAAGIFLSFWGLMLGVVRKQQTKTEGAFTGTAHGEGAIPSGTWAVVANTDLRYKVVRDIAFQEGAAFSIPVIAEHPGSSYNIGEDMPLRLTRLIPGLDAVSVREEWITAAGQDVEEDEPYRERIKTRWRDQTLGDTKDTYKYYAEEVTGVRSAKVIRAPRGPGSTDIIIAAVNGAPDGDLINAVKKN
ncbi:MAG: baseplate J/gp47 family protein, partial [Treponema sp.]|nr:baseplate J/gp47 family protein [Treponema sp.]